MFNWHYIPQIVGSISDTNIYFKKSYSPTCARMAHRNSPTNTSVGGLVSNTNIYIQLTYIPQIVGSIYSIQIYISTNLYSPTLRPKGARNSNNTCSPQVSAWYIQYPRIYSTDIYSPNCWLHLSNNKFNFFLNVKGILEGPVWSRNKAVQYICAYMPFLSFHHFEQFYVVNTTHSLFQRLIMV